MVSLPSALQALDSERILVRPKGAQVTYLPGAQWADRLPPTDIVEVGELLFYVVHNIADLDLDPPTAGFAAVVSGHSHRPSIETRDGVLYLNPGAAGPRRFKLPVSLARVTVSGRQMRPEIVELEV